MAGQEGEGRGGGGGGVGSRGEREGTGASTGDAGPTDWTRDTLTTSINHKHPTGLSKGSRIHRSVYAVECLWHLPVDCVEVGGQAGDPVLPLWGATGLVHGGTQRVAHHRQLRHTQTHSAQSHSRPHDYQRTMGIQGGL